MKREILISLQAHEKRVAILEDGKLEEIYMERANQSSMFGNIYKGKVKTVIKGIGASFVDLGTEKDGFLYVADALQIRSMKMMPTITRQVLLMWMKKTKKSL
jgi:ribonuclease G